MLREIKVYPDPVLRERSADVELIDDELRTLVADMVETMRAACGLGLAAPQVGLHQRLIVIDTAAEEGRSRSEPTAYINPEILSRSGRDTLEEGCLSLPGLQAPVERSSRVTVVAQLLDGSEVEIRAEGLLARAFQHEIDHLDGRLYIDLVRPDDLDEIRTDLLRLEEVYKAGTPSADTD